jgi:O-antigen ligase
LRGILAHGIAHAGNDSRPFAAFLIACLYFLTAPVDPQSVRKYVVVLLYFGLGLALVMLLASVGLPVGGVAMANHDPDQLAMLDGRLLPADSALALAFCFFFSIASFDRKRMSLLSKSLPMLFLGAVVLLRHRTVWVVLIAVLIYFLLKDRATFRRLVPLGVLACLVMAVYAGFLAGSSAHSLGATFSDSATNDITWQWRLAGWLQLLGNERATAINIMFGNSLGGGYERFDPISLVYIDTIPHSEYVTQYFNLGVAGLAMVLCLMIRPFQRFWKLSSTNMQAVAPSASAWAVVILGIMVYGISYDPPVEAYALLGIANAMVIRLDKSTQNRVPAPALAQAG